MSGICVILEQRGGEAKRASIEALAEALRNKDALGGSVTAVLIGSGMSFHNIPLMRASLATPAPATEAFDRWLQEKVVLPQAERDAALAEWQQVPGALLAHPDAEHLVPLHVVAGAAADSLGRCDFHQVAMGVPLAGFVFAD